MNKLLIASLFALASVAAVAGPADTCKTVVKNIYAADVTPVRVLNTKDGDLVYLPDGRACLVSEGDLTLVLSEREVAMLLVSQ